MLDASGRERGAAVNWSPAIAVIGTIVIYFLSQFLVGISFGIIFGVTGWNDNQVDDWAESTTGQFIIMASSALFTALILGAFLKVQKSNIRALGFARPPRLGDLLQIVIGFAAYFGLFILTAIIAGIAGVNTDQEQEIGFELVGPGGGELALVFISLVILPPIVEEVLFRGFLYGGLRKKFTFIGAALITSLLFAAPHLLATSSGLLWIAAVDTFVLSLVLCYMRDKTGALWACIGIHAVKNCLAFLYRFVIQ